MKNLKTKSIATRMDIKTLEQLKEIYKDESPSEILRHLAEERIAVERNTRNLNAARRSLEGKKADRSLL